MRTKTPKPIRPAPPGYTLVEFLVVFAIIMLMAGIIWPALGQPSELTLETAAADVLAACRYARSEASGWRHCLRFREGTAAERPVLELVAIAPWAADGDAVPAQPPYDRAIEVPEGTQVELLPLAMEDDAAGESPTVSFYPDGSSDGGEIRLIGPRVSFQIRVARYTGRAEMRQRWTADLDAEAQSPPEEAGP
jgi:type II secretory pathway pseudopilin PulG